VYVIPFQLNAREYSIFVVLQEEGLKRIRAYDPAQVNVQALGPAFTHLRLKDIHVGYATDSEIREVLRLAELGRVQDGLKWLSRGFEFKPEFIHRGEHPAGSVIEVFYGEPKERFCRDLVIVLVKPEFGDHDGPPLSLKRKPGEPAQ